MSKKPYVSFSNDEIKDNPKIKKGDTITCPTCGSKHVIKYGVNGKTGAESDLLCFYTCGKATYLAGVSGKNIMGKLEED